MPLEVRHQVFRRYFSTKAASGRGIGTWSVKLLTERYLGGTVSFRCQDGNTIFEAVFPVA
jgi:sensor histidine kinase regulating citrate/malate metabolism